VVFSPQANYIDREIDRRLLAKLVPTFADTGCRVVSASDPPVVNSVFLTGADPLVVQPVASRYTDCAIPALLLFIIIIVTIIIVIQCSPPVGYSLFAITPKSK
jgi:hypothetical protein